MATTRVITAQYSAYQQRHCRVCWRHLSLVPLPVPICAWRGERAYWHSNNTRSRQRSSCREWPCQRFICVVILYTLRVLRTNGLQEQSLTNALCCSHWQAAVLWSGMVWPLDFCSAADWKRLKSSLCLWKTGIPWRDGDSPVSCRHVISKSLAKQVMPSAQLQ